jgi:hypothetical protein
MFLGSTGDDLFLRPDLRATARWPADGRANRNDFNGCYGALRLVVSGVIPTALIADSSGN